MGKKLKKKLEGGSQDDKEVVPTKKTRRALLSTNDEEATVNGAGSSKRVHKNATFNDVKTAKVAKKGKAEVEKSSSKKSPRNNAKNKKAGNSATNRKNRASSNEEEDSDDETQAEYEVEDIVGHKEEGGKSYYLIRWKGYTKDDDSWALESTLSCPQLIEKFNKQSANGNVTPKKAKNKESNKTDKTDKNKATPKKSTTATPSAKKSDDNEWEVEKIIDYTVVRGARVFRIRWKGFKPKDDTWEPESNLHCDEIIAEFMKKMEAQDNVSVKELRENPTKPKRLVNETSRRVYGTPSERKSKRSSSKKMVYYGDSDE